jgi:serine/threonine-protein kinase
MSVPYDGGSTEVPPPTLGDVVGGRYRLTGALGEGGMGLVFEAEHLRLRQKVAIKFLRGDVLCMADAVERFEREARVCCRLRGPHVAHVLDVDTDDQGRPYMVMELLRGRDLEAELRARGALPVHEAVDWILQACAAVGEAHAAGIVHRDLKPSNLFLAEETGTRVLKVLDFGISKAGRDEPSVTSAAVTVGTPLYMSPEQVRSSRDVDGRADIWSLGVILFELVAGAPPFLGTTTAAIAAIVADATPSLRRSRPEVPEDLELAVATALAKSPEDRFPTAEAFSAALAPFASADGIAGPFSLRPSQQAFEIACSTMRRTPSGPRASDPSELLRLPGPGTNGREGRWVVLRTFVGTAAIGVGLATAAALCTSSTGGAAHQPPEHAAQPPPPAPPDADASATGIELGPAATVGGRAASAAPSMAAPTLLRPLP